MSERDHQTERGALLDSMEHDCIRPGKWLVEGRIIERRPTGWVLREGETSDAEVLSTHPTFTDALMAVAERINDERPWDWSS